MFKNPILILKYVYKKVFNIYAYLKNNKTNTRVSTIKLNYSITMTSESPVYSIPFCPIRFYPAAITDINVTGRFLCFILKHVFFRSIQMNMHAALRLLFLCRPRCALGQAASTSCRWTSGLVPDFSSVWLSHWHTDTQARVHTHDHKQFCYEHPWCTRARVFLES